MKVSLNFVGRNVVAPDVEGVMWLEVGCETDTERSFLRGLEDKEKTLRVAIGDNGQFLRIYTETIKKGK